MKRKIQKFLATTAVGSLIKTFLVGMFVFLFGEVIKAQSFAGLGDLKKLAWSSIWAGGIAVANVAYNYFNRNYLAYGKQPKLKDLPIDPIN